MASILTDSKSHLEPAQQQQLQKSPPPAQDASPAPPHSPPHSPSRSPRPASALDIDDSSSHADEDLYINIPPADPPAPPASAPASAPAAKPASSNASLEDDDAALNNAVAAAALAAAQAAAEAQAQAEADDDDDDDEETQSKTIEAMEQSLNRHHQSHSHSLHEPSSSTTTTPRASSINPDKDAPAPASTTSSSSPTANEVAAALAAADTAATMQEETSDVVTAAAAAAAKVAAATADDYDADVKPTIRRKKQPQPAPPQDDDDILRDSARPWPIDKIIDDQEFHKIPRALRESLFTASEYTNGLTYIPQIQSKAFDTKDSAVSYLNNFASQEGFELQQADEQEQHRVVLTCCHAQQFQSEKFTPLKRSHAEMSDIYDPCPFRAVISHNPSNDTWYLDAVSPDHNHGPTGPAASAKRRRFTYFQRTLREDFVPRPRIFKPGAHSGLGTSTPPIFQPPPSIISSSYPSPNEADDKKHVDSLRGLVGALRFDNAHVEDRVDSNGSVTHLFWTTRDCMEMLQMFPEVLFINIVRGPNVPPLVHIVGITCFNTTFEVGYAFIKSHVLDGLVWALNSLKVIATKALQKEYKPSAVITHHDLQLMGAVELQFENTSQFCVSQLMRDVNEKANDFFGTPTERRQFIEKFQRLVDSETADIYSFNEADFRKDYQGTKIFEYVTYQWLQQKSRFVRAYVDQHLHFNNYSMGKAENAQATIANYVNECNGDVLKLYYRISSLLKRKKLAFENRVKSEQERVPMKFFVPFFDQVRLKISTHALELIKEQHELYIEAQSVHEPLSRCTSMFTNTTGLPCKHTLARSVTMDDIHPHWWLNKQKNYQVPLSDHDRRAIDLTSKFDHTLSLAKQHFLNYSQLDLREYMLVETMKYFYRFGVPGIDARATLTQANSNGSSSSNGGGSGAGTPAASPLLSSRATPPPAMSPNVLSGASSPIHPSMGAGRVSTPTTTHHKHIVNGLASPSTKHAVPQHHDDSGHHTNGTNTGNTNTAAGSLDGSPDIPMYPGALRSGAGGNSSAGSSAPHHDFSAIMSPSGTETTNTPLQSQAGTPGPSHGTPAPPQNNTSGSAGSSNGSSSNSGTQKTPQSSGSTAEFNELAAAAAAAAAIETGPSGYNVHTYSHGSAAGAGSHTYPHLQPHHYAQSQSQSQQQPSYLNAPAASSPAASSSAAAGSSSSATNSSGTSSSYEAGGATAAHHVSAALSPLFGPRGLPPGTYPQPHLHLHSHHPSPSQSQPQSQPQTPGGGGDFSPAPRKCGKCNQIGHNSRTCGQRISLDGL